MFYILVDLFMVGREYLWVGAEGWDDLGNDGGCLQWGEAVRPSSGQLSFPRLDGGCRVYEGAAGAAIVAIRKPAIFSCNATDTLRRVSILLSGMISDAPVQCSNPHINKLPPT